MFYVANLESCVGLLDEAPKLHFQKSANAAEKVFADRATLFNENKNLTDQHKEKSVRESTKLTVVGKAKIISYIGIVEAKKKRDERDAKQIGVPRTRERKGNAKQMPTNEMDQAVCEIAEIGLSGYCSVLRL